MTRKILLSGILFLLSYQVATAQEYDKVEGVWNAVFVDLPLSDNLSLRSEFHTRTIDYFNVWSQQIF